MLLQEDYWIELEQDFDLSIAEAPHFLHLQAIRVEKGFAQ